MGCEMCRDEKYQLSNEIALPKGLINNPHEAEFSEPLQSAIGPLTHEKDPTPLHNILKESRPTHVKMAVDPGRIGRLSCGQIVIPRSTKNSLKDSARVMSSELPAKIVVRNAEEFRLEAAHVLKIERKNSAGLQIPRSDSRRSISSNGSANGSVAFDPGCVVVEKKTGSIYDEYRVVDVLGRGSFGEVKKVVHRVTGKAYALKIINKNYCSENGNILNEISILKKLVSGVIL